jgi:hypothetical protein
MSDLSMAVRLGNLANALDRIRESGEYNDLDQVADALRREAGALPEPAQLRALLDELQSDPFYLSNVDASDWFERAYALLGDQ